MLFSAESLSVNRNKTSKLV